MGGGDGNGSERRGKEGERWCGGAAASKVSSKAAVAGCRGSLETGVSRDRRVGVLSEAELSRVCRVGVLSEAELSRVCRVGVRSEVELSREGASDA